MKQMKFTSWGMACALACGLLLSSCTADGDGIEIPEGKGAVRLSLTADAGFGVSTKAVTEEDYLKAEEYTVELLKNGVVYNNFSYLYSDIPDFTEVNNGTYTFTAHKGDKPDQAVYTVDELYFYGDTTFSIANDTARININCKPNSARINVAFDEKMNTYFSDYSLRISTEAVKNIQKQDGYTWSKETQGPLYFKVNNKENVKVDIILTPKDTSKEVKTINKTYTLSPADALKLTISPNVSNGGLNGIKIDFDDTTVEKHFDVKIPNGWV